jgi:hypothetical protein
MEIDRRDLEDWGVKLDDDVEEVSVWPMLCAALGVFAFLLALVGAIVISESAPEKPVAVKCK